MNVQEVALASIKDKMRQNRPTLWLGHAMSQEIEAVRLVTRMNVKKRGRAKKDMVEYG